MNKSYTLPLATVQKFRVHFLPSKEFKHNRHEESA